MKISLFNLGYLLVVGSSDHAIRYFDAFVSQNFAFGAWNRYSGWLVVPLGGFKFSTRIFFFVRNGQRVSDWIKYANQAPGLAVISKDNSVFKQVLLGN